MSTDGKTFEEFYVGQVWQPQANSRRVSRTIHSFDPRNSATLIRCASPGGRTSRYSVAAMREWIERNNAVATTAAAPAIAEPVAQISLPAPTPLHAPIISQGNTGPLQKCFTKYDRTNLFIDGPFIYGLQRKLELTVDYRKLLAYFHSQTQLIHAKYYDSILPSASHSPGKTLSDWLGYNGYMVHSDIAEEYFDPITTRHRVVDNRSTRLAVDLLTMDQRISHAVLILGGRQFVPAIAALKLKGVIVTIIGITRDTHDLIRREADNFINFEQLITEAELVRHHKTESQVA